MKILKYLMISMAMIVGSMFFYANIPLYFVHPGDTAVVVRMGRFIKSTSKPGLYFKIPFMEMVLYLKEMPEVITDEKEEPIICGECKFPLSIYDEGALIYQEDATCSRCLWDKAHRDEHQKNA